MWGEDRETATAKLDKALKSTHIAGLPTNIDFVRTVLKHPEFIKVFLFLRFQYSFRDLQGNVYTDFIPDFKDELFTEDKATSEQVLSWYYLLELFETFRWLNRLLDE